MMMRKSLDLWVGVFVAIGLGALLFLALKVGNLASFSAAETYLVKANFDNIGGLKKRAPVKSAAKAMAAMRRRRCMEEDVGRWALGPPQARNNIRKRPLIIRRLQRA